MKVKIIAGCFLLLLVVTGCSSIIYAIRGAKYKGKFDKTTLPKEFDSISYFEGVTRVKMLKEDDVIYYNYFKFNNNGIYYGYTSDEQLTPTELDTLKPFENYYIFKNGYLRWEIYHDSYNGYNLFKASVYQDSIVAWQIGNKRATIKTYYKMK
jgi:hypothetical protein